MGVEVSVATEKRAEQLQRNVAIEKQAILKQGMSRGAASGLR
jgi:hypothetical protein